MFETQDNWIFHNLLGDPSLEGEEMLFIGQRGRYKRKTIVTLEQVLKVARRYTEDGDLEPTEVWETN